MKLQLGIQAEVRMASSSYSNSPCAACKFLRRKCTQGCVFAPYFPLEEPQKFANVHKIFGASNVSKLLNEIAPHQREDAVNSLAYEAEARMKDPVYGCVGAISVLQRQVIRLQKELDATNADLIRFSTTTSHEMPTTFPMFLGGDDNEKSTAQNDVLVIDSNPSCTGEEEYNRDQKDKNRPNSSKDASPELASEDQSCTKSNDAKNTNDKIRNKEAIQVYKDPKVSEIGEDLTEGEELTHNKHSVIDHSPESTGKHTTKCSQQNETEAKKHKAESHLIEETELTSKKEEGQTGIAETVEVEEAETDEEEGDEYIIVDLGFDAPVIVEASRETDVKIAQKKSHTILSGVGSKVKHSLAKVKKVITG